MIAGPRIFLQPWRKGKPGDTFSITPIFQDYRTSVAVTGYGCEMDFVLPLIILIARIVETTMKTIRLVYVTKGHRHLASFIGALKIGVWIISTGLVLTNLDNIPGILAYMLGYGLGTLLGMTIESWIGLGMVVVRIFCADDPEPLISRMGKMGFGTTRINGAGQFEPEVAVLICIVPRTELKRLLEMIRSEYPWVHFTIEEVSTMSEREIYFGGRTSRSIRGFLGCE